MSARRARRGRFYAGWRVVAGAFLLVLSGFGAIYSYAAFTDDIAGAFGADLVSVSVIYALSGGACFMVSALSGPLADRLGPRVPAMAGMAMVAVGLLVAASAKSLVEIYAGYGLLIGLGTGFAYVPAMATVQRWFTTHRGLASGIAASGIGVGTALVPPAADAFLAAFDWRTTFAVFGALVAATGLLGAWLLEPGGRRQPGRPPPRAATQAVPAAPLRGRAFALAWCGTLLVSVPATLPHAMLVGTARDLGIARGDALALLGLIGLGTIAGRFLIAAAADSIGRRATFLGCCAGMAASMVAWALAGGEAALQAFALGFGALQGGFVALLPAFVADGFGARALGGILGALYTSRGVALLVAPPALAVAVTLGGHAAPLLAVAALGLLGALLLACLPARPQAPPAAQAAADRVGLALPAPQRVAALLAGLALVGQAGPARAQDGFVAMTLVWATPAAAPDGRSACARMLVLNLPRDWQAGDAGVVVAGPGGARFATEAGRLVAALLEQGAAVLELPAGRGGGIGACAAAPVEPGASALGALAALRAEVGAGVLVAVGVGEAAAEVLAAMEPARAARLSGPDGARATAGAALGMPGRAVFRAGPPPPAAEQWPARVAHLCAALAPFAGPGGFEACDAALAAPPLRQALAP
jgi:MFS family permease